jgi:hypothetical protein
VRAAVLSLVIACAPPPARPAEIVNAHVEPPAPAPRSPFHLVPGHFGPAAPVIATATADGIPVIPTAPRPSEREGDVTWIRPDDAMHVYDVFPDVEATDGKSVYFASRDDTSVLVRGGVVVEQPLRTLGLRGPGCAAARDGVLLVSGPAPSSHPADAEGSSHDRLPEGGEGKPWRQLVVRIGPDGSEQVAEVPRELGVATECRLILDDDGTFALLLDTPIRFDGTTFAMDPRYGEWLSIRTVMPTSRGPRFCFDQSCDEHERAETDPATTRLVAALGGPHYLYASWAARDRWIAGVNGRLGVRLELGGALETIAGIPMSNMLHGDTTAALTDAGDLVIGLAYLSSSYVVWRRGATTLTPVRTLAPNQVLALSTPTAIVDGIGAPLPPEQTATAVGTFFDQETVMGVKPDDYRARAARARTVLGAGRLVAVHEAVVDTTCGTYARIGWEDRVAIGPPPTGPCRKLDRVTVVPDDPDVLLALAGGKLYAARLPAPGQPPRRAWTAIGKATTLAGDDAVPLPGGPIARAAGGWVGTGTAVITAGTTTILMSYGGAITLPPSVTPLAISLFHGPRAWGAIGARLVACVPGCRTLDPGPHADLVKVVPHGDAHVALTYADGRVGAYAIPATGGQPVAPHPLAVALDRFVAANPPPPDP